MFFNSSQGPLSFTLPQIDKTATERVLQKAAVSDQQTPPNGPCSLLLAS